MSKSININPVNVTVNHKVYIKEADLFEQVINIEYINGYAKITTKNYCLTVNMYDRVTIQKPNYQDQVCKAQPTNLKGLSID